MSGEPVAFVFAMPMEIKPLVRRLSLQKTTIGDGRGYQGKLADGRDVVAIVTGMGTKFATEGTERLLNAMAVDRVVVVGITGAVENDTAIGTLVLPETVVNAATGAEYTPAPLGDGKPSGKMWTSDVLLTDLKVIADLRAQGVVSLDMETAAIAESCQRRGLPWSVFRVISDRATDGSIDDEVFHLSNQDGTLKPVAVLTYFLKHPLRIARLARLAKGATMAANRAVDAALKAVASG
jgi:adenosylhomocysteine nucleosidase